MTRSERTYYVVSGGYNLAQFFLAPVYPIFLLSRGLDLFQINLVLATYLITVFLFDVPTGAIADRFGRKRSFVAGCLVRAAAFAFYSRTHGFPDIVLAEVVDAVGTTLVTGALDAWVVDGVHAEGDHRPTDPLFARALMITRAAMIGGGIAAGYLGQWRLEVPWLVAAGLFVVVALVGTVTMKEAPPRHAPGRPAALRRAAADGVRAVLAAPVLRTLCLLALAQAFAGLPLHMLWQPRIEALTGQGPWLLGWVLALLNLAGLAGSAVLPRLLRRGSRERVLAGAALWRGATLALAAAAAKPTPAIAGLALQEVGLGLIDPVTMAWTNEHVTPTQRATVLSVRSMFFTFGGALGLVTLGLVARRVGIGVAFGVSAVLFTATTPAFLLLGRIAGRVRLRAVPTEPVPPAGRVAAQAAAAKEGMPADLGAAAARGERRG